MQNTLNFSKRHHRFFEEMTRIPHGSFHERAYSDYLVQFAQARGLTYVRDKMNNVVIYKPASPGYEDHPPVALQAHMDMVCEKDEGYEHDFTKDPLQLYIEDGYLKACHTTLGADNGTGVAYILAILDDEAAKHPPLEGIFTVQEEVGMFGAVALDKSLIHASRFISLDCGGGDSIYVSSLGGEQYTFQRQFAAEQTAAQGWQVSIQGLKGNYSTSYFRGAENAITLCAELLYSLHKALGVRLVSMDGGNDGKKIADHSQAVFTTLAAPEETQRVFAHLAETLKKEVLPGEPDCTIMLTPAAVSSQLTEESSEAALRFLYLLQSGLVSKSTQHEGHIAAVQNWTDMALTDGRMQLKCTLRGESNYKLEKLREKAILLCTLFDVEVTAGEAFPAWEFNPDSRLCAVLNKVYNRRFGTDIGQIAVEGGLECSIFCQIHPDMDVISMGPEGNDPHTTKERLNLASFDKLFGVFQELLAEL